MTLIKSISGIRGTIGGKIGGNLTPLDVVKFTSAFAQWIKNISSPYSYNVNRLRSHHSNRTYIKYCFCIKRLKTSFLQYVRQEVQTFW